GDDPDAHHPQGQAALDEDAEQVAQGEAAGEGQVTGQAVEVAHDLADGEEPDGHLEEAQERGEQPFAPRDEDDAEGAERHDADLGGEDDQRQRRHGHDSRRAEVLRLRTDGPSPHRLNPGASPYAGTSRNTRPTAEVAAFARTRLSSPREES